jgi:hypothetical protein
VTRPSTLKSVELSAPISLLKLPQEIQTMIWKEYCALLQDPETERVVVKSHGWYLRDGEPHKMGYTNSHRNYNAVPGYLEILLVSKRIFRQIEGIFWATTRFHFDSIS